MADVHLVPETVTDMADFLGTAADVIQVLDIVLTSMAAFLIATGFGSPIGAKYMGNYKSKVIDLYNKCNELDGDLKAAVQALENGDSQGATKFY